MKKSIFYVVALLTMAMTSCQANGGFNYQIDGQLPDSTWTGQTLYLTDMATGDVLDSTVIEGDSYQFKGKASQSGIAQIKFGRPAVRFILEKGNMTVDHEVMAVKGTALNDSVHTFLSEMYALMALATTEEHWQQLACDFTAPILAANADNLYGTYALWFTLWQAQPKGERFDNLMALAGDDVKAFSPIHQFILRNEVVNKTSAGNMFTDFTIPGGNLDGSDAKLSQYVGNGKYVLVDFWASWCGPCRREIPIIAEIYKKYKGPKFDVLGVAVWDEPEASRQAAKELCIVWNQIINAQSIPTDLYGIGGIPHIILFGPDGTIIERDLRGDHMKEVVAKHVGKK